MNPLTLAPVFVFAALLQSPARIGDAHAAADSISTAAATLPAHDIQLLLRVIAGVVVLQMAIFALQGWLLRRTVSEIKLSTDAVRDAVAAEQRAYLRVAIDALPHPSAWNGADPAWTARVTNGGRTPAKEIRARFEYALFEETSVVKGMAIEGTKSRWGGLESGDSLDMPLVGSRIPKEEWPMLDAGSGHTLFLYGEVWYHDVFGTEHQTTFCRHINWRNGEMVAVIPRYGNEFS